MSCQALILVAFLATVAVVQAEKPWFCQSYECPSYTSQDKGSYEIRNYVETKWVTISITSKRPDLSRRESSNMFRTLFSYISGANAKDQKIPMTVPALTKVETQSNNNYKITMMFYLALSNPPAPNSKDVFLLTKPAGPVYVRSFPGYFWPMNYKYRNQLKDMKKAVGKDSLYIDNVYYKAVYNSPYDWFKRKQFEVWIDGAQI